jgi:hypothetical protein
MRAEAQYGSVTCAAYVASTLFTIRLSSYTGHELMSLLLNERETSLLQAFRRLPADAAAELTALAERLVGVGGKREVPGLIREGEVEKGKPWDEPRLRKI